MKRYRFEAAIQRSTGWGAFVLFPHDVKTEFHIKGRVPVQALLGGVPYTGSLMPSATGYHRLSVPKDICAQLKKTTGDLIRVELWKDDGPRTVEMPEEFVRLLRKEKLSAKFASLSLTRRKEYRNWILSAKRADTRARRLARAMAILREESTPRSSAPRGRHALA
jgi:hypothetical protein